MNYFDSTTHQIQTEHALKERGLTLDPASLVSIGIFPIEYPYPTFNADTHTLEPNGNPKPKADGTAYVQNFSLVELSQEAQQANLTRKAEDKRKAALTGADAAVSGYMSLFSEVERSTWPKQQTEVEAIATDPATSTPTLDALAQARGITREEQIEKAKAKVMAFVPLSAFIIGTQQRYEDQIKAITANTAKTLAERMAELDAMAFNYALPEGV